MRPNEEFLDLDKSFWAYVRTLSEEIGYTLSGKDQIKVPSLTEITTALTSLGLDLTAVCDDGKTTELGQRLLAYFLHRAKAINEIKGKLMDAATAKKTFNEVRSRCRYSCNLPMNKQKGAKKTFAFLTCIVTMLLEEALEQLSPLKTVAVADPTNALPREEVDKLGPQTYVKRLIADGKIRRTRHQQKVVYHPQDIQRLKPHCNYDPRTLTTVTLDGRPLRTLSRRVDGAYPSPVNPIAIWEIKEITTRQVSAVVWRMGYMKHFLMAQSSKT